MDAIEKNFRDTPIDSKKYAKRLTIFIDYLVKNGKLLEAKYYFKKLSDKKPNHEKTIRLGYSLSIATFDNDGVRKFDKLLYDSKPKDVEIFWFRLKYYLSVNNHKDCEECCEFLLSKRIEIKYLNTIIEACLNLKNYNIAITLIKYLEKEKLTLNSFGMQHIKKLALERLVISIVKVKCG